MRTILFRAPVVRRMPDPVESGRGERHVLFVKASEVPADVPLDPNPRQTQNLDRMVYRDVAQTLRNEIGDKDTFHLKNKGITIIAKDLKKDEDDKVAILLETGQGILDGGHTYRIIREAIKEKACPATQFVKVEVLTGYDPKLTEEIAEGLNSSVQVQEKTLADQRRQFDWMKLALKGTPFEEEVAFRENEKAAYDIREIVAFATLFNIAKFPNEKGTIEHPIQAFNSKEATLNRYLEDEGDNDNPGGRTFRKLRELLPDILKLQEIVASEAAPIHNKKNGGKAGKLSFVDYNEDTPHKFPFTGEEGAYKLRAGAIYPTLGAFRYLVEEDKLTGLYRWRTKDGFEGVKRVWRDAAPELMRNLSETNEDVNRSVTQLGKNKTLWTSQYNTVKATFLEAEIE